MTSGIPLSSVQIRILCTLLEGENVSDFLRENHIMPSIAADEINELLFDEFGDTVVLCKGDKLFLVDDYVEDLEQYLGGIIDG